MNQFYYAGIGSRETPQHFLNIMCHVGSHLYANGWTLRSGAAEGADRAFEKGCDIAAGQFDQGARKEIYLPWARYNNSNSAFHPALYPFTDEEEAFTARFHPAWNKCSPSAKRLHIRNTRILLGMETLHGEQVKPVHFIVCWTQNGQIKGGTGQALRIAEGFSIPVFNLGKASNPDELGQMLLEIDNHQMSSRGVKAGHA